MKQVMLYRGKGGHLVPFDADAREYVRNMRTGQAVLCSMHFPRNPKLHKKFFAMLAFAYDHWDPPERMHGGKVAFKDRETFRAELTIAAGYYEVVAKLDGEPYLRAQSIAWDSMGEEKFSKLYEAVVGVLSRGFLPGITAEVMEEWASQYAEAA